MTEEEWLTSSDPVEMLGKMASNWSGFGCEKPILSDRKIHLLGCACCRAVWPLFADHRSRRAVEVAERHADGEAADSELREAERSAFQVDLEHWDGATQRFVGGEYGRNFVMAACYCAATDDLLQRFVHLSNDLNGGLHDGNEAHRLPRASQADILREIVGNPYRPVYAGQPRDTGLLWHGNVKVGPHIFPESWLTPTVLDLATVAYRDRLSDSTLDPGTLAALSDALEEAGATSNGCIHCGYGAYINLNPPCGCASTELLLHLRSSNSHVRGCWVLDLLLGKE